MANPYLLETLLTAALAGLHYYAMSGSLQLSAEHRLAFRELGLAIGLQAVRLIGEANRGPTQSATPDGVRIRLRELVQYVPVGERIESFWRDRAHRRSPWPSPSIVT